MTVDPARVIADVWQVSLPEGVADRDSPWHTPTLATVGPDGRPRCRTVVLRKIEPAERVLICHADVRSPKIDELRRDGRVAWCFYDHPRKTQVRIEGRATVHTDDAIADGQWAASHPASRACYRAATGPSTAVDPPEVGQVAGDGREHFAVIRATADVVEWLWLHHAGHRRLRFTPDGAGWRHEWLAP